MTHTLSVREKEKDAPTVSLSEIRGTLVIRGTSLASWARRRGVHPATMHNAVTGKRTGPKSRRLAAELLRELGL